MDQRIFYLLFEAEPRTPPVRLEDDAGAFVNCWIRAESFGAAEAIARMALDASEWRVAELKEGAEVTRQQYVGQESLENFNEAEECGQSFAFYISPLGEADEDKLQ